MMKKLPYVLLVSILALGSGGCGLFQSSEETTESPPTEPSAESPTAEPPEKAFSEPSPSTDSLATIFTPDLIPSTNPSQRREVVRSELSNGQKNPFAVLPVQPTIIKKVAVNGVDPKSLCVLEESKPETVAQAPKSEPKVEEKKPLEPVIPIPNEARGVLVSGIVKLQGTPVAIVQAPGEGLARQVTAGTRLSNGQVLVKAININGDEPYVLLEQYGLDIPRYVGEEPEEPIAPPPPPESETVSESEPESQAVAPPPGPNGFGKVRNLVLLTLNIGDVILGEGQDEGEGRRPRTAASGILCNDGYSPIRVKKLLLQVEDKETKAVIDSFDITLGNSYSISPGQKAEFDGGIPKLRGRKRGDVDIRLVSWN